MPTRLHGVLDYPVSALVIALPFLLGWGGSAQWIYPALGCFGIGYSLMTDYEWGAFRVLSMPVHLMLDGVFGAALLIVPVVLGSPPHSRISIAIGAMSLLLAMLTQRRSGGAAGAMARERS